MLIVISCPTAVTGEADIMNALFDEGLDVLHIRKPTAAVDEIKVLIDKIKPAYRQQIALHQQHQSAAGFGIRRLHFTEVNRKEISEDALKKLKETNHIVSTSIHNVEEYAGLSPCFDYTFFGPVFNSISKQGYSSIIPAGFNFPVREKYTKVIAIGGIDATNICRAVSMNFDGAATIGAIWQKPDESIKQFKLIQKAWQQAGR